MVSGEEFDAILRRCAQVPPASEGYLENDYISNLLLTVLDFRMKGTVINGSLAHYRSYCWADLRSLDQLEALLVEHTDDVQGNTRVAIYLWGNRLWTRVALLRKLAIYFRSVGVTCQDELSCWARSSDYERDFKDRIPGMGYAIYKWIIMRQGVETFKPDVHLKGFVRSIIRRNLPDAELVRVLEGVAKQLGVNAYDLHNSIWEYQRGYAGR